MGVSGCHCDIDGSIGRVTSMAGGGGRTGGRWLVCDNAAGARGRGERVLDSRVHRLGIVLAGRRRKRVTRHCREGFGRQGVLRIASREWCGTRTALQVLQALVLDLELQGVAEGLGVVLLGANGARGGSVKRVPRRRNSNGGLRIASSPVRREEEQEEEEEERRRREGEEQKKGA